ncbi:MAG TPA: hypothetical protein VEP30_14025 [Chthoniobacterales bacterium]|nr:hypothetical protein [Chthoniobacterales bacterium]
MAQECPRQNGDSERNMKNSNASHVPEVPLGRERTLGNVGFRPDAAFEEIWFKQVHDAYANKNKASEFSVTVHRLDMTGEVIS